MAPYLPKIQDCNTAWSAYVPPLANYATNMTLDWATDIDESISPVPGMSNFHPTKPPSPLLNPNPAPCSPNNPIMPAKPVCILPAPTSLRDLFVFAKPNHTSTKTTTALITGETAPRINTAHCPTSLSGMDRHPKGLGEPLSPLASPQPAPSLCVRDLSSNQQSHVTVSKQRAPLEPTVTPPNSNAATKTVPNGCSSQYSVHQTHTHQPSQSYLITAEQPCLLTHLSTLLQYTRYLFTLHMISQVSNQVCKTHGAASITIAITFTCLGITCSHLQNNFSHHLNHIPIYIHRIRFHIHIHIRLHGHNPIYAFSHILQHNFNQLFIYFKLFKFQHPHGISPTKPKL